MFPAGKPSLFVVYSSGSGLDFIQFLPLENSKNCGAKICLSFEEAAA
jgi:hypothetical protein